MRPARMRSRSPRLQPLGVEAREAALAEFARNYWIAPDGDDVPAWAGERALEVMRYRRRLLDQVWSTADDMCDGLWKGESPWHPEPSRGLILKWQRFTFYEDLLRMSDVLFRGPIEPNHAHDVDERLHLAWRRFRGTVGSIEVYMQETVDFRVSAVRMAMVLETARPAEATHLDYSYELPDARTLASLLALRCEKDEEEELLEMYRLVCQKLGGCRCTWCMEVLDESSAGGTFDGATLAVPVTVPKILVPPCGHAIHTLCFGSQLLPDSQRSGVRGHCRRCGVPYGWTAIDVDPMVSAFCLLFGSYVDKQASEMLAEGCMARSAILSIAEICQSFSLELDGLVSSHNAWVLLTQRHAFECPKDTIEIIGQAVMDLLTNPSPGQDGDEEPHEPHGPLVHPAVVCPDDRPDADEDSLSDASSGLREERKHLTEVFLPDVEIASDGGDSAAAFSECADVPVPEDELPPLSPLVLPPSAVRNSITA